MKSMFNAADNRALVERINLLQEQTTPLWGKMTVGQMLAHCQQPMKVALGEAKGSQSLMGKLFGGIAKKQILNDKPIKRNLPTDKTFLVRDKRNFNEEKARLIELVKKFQSQGPSMLSKDPHPFFGKLTEEQWDKLSWKHLDHHLQQFGV